MLRFWFALYVALVALSPVQSTFVEPKSDVEDYSQSWKIGDTMNIQWSGGWSGINGPQPDRVDLFITWFKSDAYSQLLKGKVSIPNYR